MSEVDCKNTKMLCNDFSIKQKWETNINTHVHASK